MKATKPKSLTKRSKSRKEALGTAASFQEAERQVACSSSFNTRERIYQGRVITAQPPHDGLAKSPLIKLRGQAHLPDVRKALDWLSRDSLIPNPKESRGRPSPVRTLSDNQNPEITIRDGKEPGSALPTQPECDRWSALGVSLPLDSFV